MTSPILVTGGTGTLGRLVVRRLRGAGRDVQVLSRRSHDSEDDIRFLTGEGLVAAANPRSNKGRTPPMAASPKGGRRKSHETGVEVETMSAMGKIGSRTAQAGRFVAGWVEDRTGAISGLARFLNHPAPKRGAWMYALGTTALFLMTLQFLTGILLLFYYVPTTDHAWNSIFYIMHDAYFGQLIRGIHYWSANFLLAFIGLHMVQVFLSGAYKAPREVNWVLGVTLLLLTLAIAFTGYVLRWDQDGFWATVVGIKIGSYSPFVGSPVTHFLLGGDVTGPATLSRFFALHVWVLPALIAPLVLVHGVVLVLKHRVFGGEMEYRDRIARLRERRRLEEYGRYEEEDEEPYRDGRG